MVEIRRHVLVGCSSLMLGLLLLAASPDHGGLSERAAAAPAAGGPSLNGASVDNDKAPMRRPIRAPFRLAMIDPEIDPGLNFYEMERWELRQVYYH